MTASALFDDEVLLLLQAALLPAERALPAYRAWRARYDIDTIRPGPMRLLPLVHANVAQHAADDALIARIKGIRKYWWLRNQMLAAAAAHAVCALAERGIPTILLKGAAMVADWYRDAALRPMGDVDILVPGVRARDAVRCLGDAGWAPMGSTIAALCEVHLERLHAWNFADGAGRSLDLHWRALHQAQQEDADAALWSRARPARIAGATTAVLAPEEQAFHVLAHGLQASAEDRFSWPADAAWILRRDGAGFDWERVVALARRARLTLQLGAGLDFLRRALAVPVSDAALAALQPRFAAWTERREFALRRMPQPERGAWAERFLAFQDFRRRGDLIARPALFGALPFLQHAWRLDAPGNALTYGAAAALARPAALRRWWLLRPRRRVLAALRLRPFAPGVLSFAEPLDDSLVYGWSEPEPGGRWTDGTEAVVALDLSQPPQGDLQIAADATPLLAQRRRSIAVDVWVNERFAARWRARLGREGAEPWRCTVPAGALAGARQLVITLVIRRPRRPADIADSPDRRRLGIFVRALSFAVGE
jgi:hypothetical protein